MAMTFAEQETFVADDAWIAATKQAMIQVARAVRVEGATEPNHDLRAALQVQVMAEPDLWKVSFIAAIATDAALDTTPTDAELVTAVEDAWDDLAGVPGPA